MVLCVTVQSWLNCNDLPKLKAVYKDIIQNMDNHHIQIWDAVYPCAFFDDDIRNNRLYILLDNKEIISSFSLLDANSGEKSVKWQDNQQKAIYLDRFGVNVNYLRMGIGSLMLEKAKEITKNLGARYLRLFVVDINEPTIHLYVKNGFIRAKGIYDERIDDDLVLHEYGFETLL